MGVNILAVKLRGGAHAHLDQDHTARRAAVHSFNRMSASQHPNRVNKAGGEVAVVVSSWLERFYIIFLVEE